MERCTAESEVVLWLREVFKTAGEKYREKYNIIPNDKLLGILMHAQVCIFVFISTVYIFLFYERGV